MRPIAALRDGLGAVVRTPLLVGVVFALALLSGGSTALQWFEPIYALPIGLLSLVITPFAVGGTIALADAALDGRTRLASFVEGGRDNYVGILGGGVLLVVAMFAVYVVVGILVTIVSVVLIGVSLGTGGGEPGMAALVVLVLLALLSFLLVLLPWFLAMFFPAAQVIEDADLTDSFSRSLHLVGNHTLSSMGFVLVSILLSIPAQLPTAYLYAAVLSSLEELETVDSVLGLLTTTELAVYVGSQVLLTTIVGTVSVAYYVAFFRRLPETGEADDETSAGTGGGRTAEQTTAEDRSDEDSGPVPPAD